MRSNLWGSRDGFVRPPSFIEFQISISTFKSRISHHFRADVGIFDNTPRVGTDLFVANE